MERSFSATVTWKSGPRAIADEPGTLRLFAIFDPLWKKTAVPVHCALAPICAALHVKQATGGQATGGQVYPALRIDRIAAQEQPTCAASMWISTCATI